MDLSRDQYERGKPSVRMRVCNTDLYCLTACLYAKCCNLIGWIMERGPSIHFRKDGPDHLYGFRSKLKRRIFWEDGRETIDRGREKFVTFGKLSVNFRKLSGKNLKQ